MKLIFYRNKKSGELTTVFKALEWSDEELNKRVTEFNANENNFVTAEVIEADEHMEFVFNKSEEKRMFSKRAIQEALDALDTARNCIDCLEVAETKEGADNG
ncbi:MAG: hypothetical protein IJD49_04335 [Clostridia bacterium]|nr:hypothetical protein [Clostridia bacterium]